jgi:hypothetical protein
LKPFAGPGSGSLTPRRVEDSLQKDHPFTTLSLLPRQLHTTRNPRRSCKSGKKKRPREFSPDSHQLAHRPGNLENGLPPLEIPGIGPSHGPRRKWGPGPTGSIGTHRHEEAPEHPKAYG